MENSPVNSSVLQCEQVAKNAQWYGCQTDDDQCIQAITAAFVQFSTYCVPCFCTKGNDGFDCYQINCVMLNCTKNNTSPTCCRFCEGITKPKILIDLVIVTILVICTTLLCLYYKKYATTHPMYGDKNESIVEVLKQTKEFEKVVNSVVSKTCPYIEQKSEVLPEYEP